MIKRLIITGVTALLLLCGAEKVHASSYYWAPKTKINNVEVTVSTGTEIEFPPEVNHDFEKAGDNLENEQNADPIIREARKYLGVPYVLGGKPRRTVLIAQALFNMYMHIAESSFRG